MKNLHLLSFGFLLLTSAGCQQQPAATITPDKPGYNQFQDATLRKIHDLQDERNTAELLKILERPEVIYRKEAMLAFASVQDKAVGDTLIWFLKQDPEPEVRKAVAYSIGQLADTTLQTSLIPLIKAEKNNAVKAEILEALGKNATKPGMAFLSEYQSTDAREKTGQAWGLYRAAIRKAPASATSVAKIIALLAEPEKETRHGAAQFLARAPKIEFSEHYAKVISVAKNDPETDVRIVATQALGKTKSDKLTDDLIEILLKKQEDYRVHISAIRAMQSLDNEAANKVVMQKLSAENPNVAVAAAEYFKIKGTEKDAADLLTKIRSGEIKNWRAKALVYESVLKLSKEKAAVNEAIKSNYQQTENNYEKGHLLQALAKDPANLEFIRDETFTTKEPVISTYGMEALAEMAKNQESMKRKAQFAQIFKAAIETGDVAMVGLAAGAIRNPETKMQETYKDGDFLQTAAGKLNLPRAIETYQELMQTIAYLNKKDPETIPRPKGSNPINWETIKSLKPDQKVLFRTTKGDITYQLYVNEAPGSVANFVDLVNKGFYNNKNFHRVVPNFVAQGGDPRGDGWGSSDQTIRSEFGPLHYETGTVGMASAGKDTESCQWFITHNPTPHLDGRYTIFAKVVSGMEVVHQLEIGDLIKEVKLVK